MYIYILCVYILNGLFGSYFVAFLYCHNKKFLDYIFIVKAICCFYNYLDMNNSIFPYMYIVVCICLVCGKTVTAHETGSGLHCT